MAAMNKAYIYLLVAIVTEVIATSCLKASAGFTRPLPSVVTVLGYGTSFYFLSLTLATIPTGIAYAIWCGVGIVLISLVGWIVFKQELDAPAILGMTLIAAGVAVINAFSRSSAH
jgi:small multidrug resistance pump